MRSSAARLKLDDIETGDLVHVETESEDDAANKLADYVTYWWAVGAADYIKTAERTGDNPTIERGKREQTKKMVSAKYRAAVEKGVTAKARKDADRSMRAVYLTTEAAAAMEALFDGGDGNAETQAQTVGKPAD